MSKYMFYKKTRNFQSLSFFLLQKYITSLKSQNIWSRKGDLIKQYYHMIRHIILENKEI